MRPGLQRLFILLWTLKLQLFPVAILAGTADEVRIFFPGKDKTIEPGDMRYKLTAIDDRLPLGPIRAVLNTELEKYGNALPVPLNIYVYASIEDLTLEQDTYGAIGGLFAPGTSVHCIYLVAGAYIVNALHHELASILMYYHYAENRTYRRKCRRFFAELRRNNEYAGMRIPIDVLQDHWKHLGATNYAMTDPENDFSLIAEYLFNPRPLQETSGTVSFWVYMDWARTLEYPVFSKVKKVIELYQLIDPRFTESFFRSLEKVPERYYYTAR